MQTPAQNHRQPRQRTFPLTFESFTVGPCNALAREAAFVIANPQQAGLDQLYIVSPSGLGKTHLARSVIDASRRSLGERARYTTAEAFTNEFTQSVQSNQMTRFKRRFRNDCDLLVVEDIQFLARKENTQLEFFHTVQHVLDCGGRVLLTGEKFPEELMELDPRLRARIASGLIAELDFPDAEVRRNILRAKAAHGGIRLPESCLDLLVDQIRGNVRELEGALIQLVATSSLLKRPIDVALAEESLLRRGRKPSLAQPRPTPEEIIKVVATFFQKPPEALASRSRRRDVLLPRQLAMYLCRRYTDASLAEIGRAMDRNHPSVANAIQNIERQVLEKVPLRYQVESLIARLDELGYKPIHGKF